ncbi:Zn-dependent hydrolase [uncultured Cohaesibacter sp.]|uniref:Zn-dependent hydrolase n=1 Tax=uncultured Cohaesibacter sp. TaxID=1002546 RepID=UPI0029C8A7C4|nr:Zn-dependent hydrolase [uncultured Cohaesibacter sp.]
MTALSLSMIPSNTHTDYQAIASQLFDEIAAFSADVQGISRPAFSELETRTLAYLADFAESHGLDVSYDAGQNAVFTLPCDTDAEAFVIVGSHVDTVPQGGNFDGLAGIITGLMCLVRAQNEGLRFAQPVKVLAMRGEESAWFGPCYIASKALLGRLTPEELRARHKGDRKTLDEHMEAVGIDMAAVRDGQPLLDTKSVRAYIELHIEQGPLLVQKDLPAAVVSGIRGNFRHQKIRCVGEAGHSGAVPRAFRRDPVLALADLLTRLDESWLTILQKGDDLVLTSGIVSTDVERHALSRIPDWVDFSLDIRSQSSHVLKAMQELLAQEMRTIERERRVSFELDDTLLTAPALSDPTIVEGMKSAMETIGLEPFVMASGAGHDAAVFANAGVPTAMVFVRNRNGSHNPAEAMDIPDFMIATEIIYTYLMEAKS